jgi:hypothetical protein
MPNDRQDGRHQTHANIEAFWASDNPQVLPLSGVPYCEIRLDPESRIVSLATDYQRPEPDVARHANLSFASVVENGSDTALLSVSVGAGIHAAYGLLTAVADGMQLDGYSFASAAGLAIDRYGDVLALRSRLSDQVEIGLFGELLVLRHVIRTLGPERALQSWQGPLSEEHDFTFDQNHVEVKTTSAERRLHVINGLTQLVPTVGIPLYLLSIQLTRSTPIAGRNLPSLISDVRRVAGLDTSAFDLRVRRQGWRADDADLYPTYWAARSLPRMYEVGASFPALTRERVARVIPSPTLVSEVSYTVDVTDMAHVEQPLPMVGFDGEGKSES